MALTYGVTAQAIADANGLTLYSILYVGQTLTIP
jgi:LysM repeat protein